MRWPEGITNAMNMNLGKLQEMARDRESWCAAARGVTKRLTRPVTEQQQQQQQQQQHGSSSISALLPHRRSKLKQ